MKNNDLKRLSRGDLITIIYQMKQGEEALKAELALVTEQLQARELKLAQSGSIAEAALNLHGVLEATQAAADDYLESLRAAHAQEEAGLEQARLHREQLTANAQAEAEAILSSARSEAETALESARVGSQNLLSVAKAEADKARSAAHSEAVRILEEARAEAERLLACARQEAAPANGTAKDAVPKAQTSQPAVRKHKPSKKKKGSRPYR